MGRNLGWTWRLAVALVISFLVTAVMTGASLVLGSAFPGSWSVSEVLGPMVIGFGAIFIFWYFTWVRETAKMAEFERLSRVGATLSRRKLEARSSKLS